jgi:hypothetical protein
MFQIITRPSKTLSSGTYTVSLEVTDKNTSSNVQDTQTLTFSIVGANTTIFILGVI